MSFVQRQRFQEHPPTEKAKNHMSQARKQYYQRHPEAARRHSEFMKRRFADPRERKAASERTKKWFQEHPDAPELCRGKRSASLKRYYRIHPKPKMSDAKKREMSGIKKRYYAEHPEARRAQSERMRVYCAAHPEFNKLSEEAKQRISEALKDYYRRNPGEGHRRNSNPGARKKISEGLKRHYADPAVDRGTGKTVGETTRQKLSEAGRRRYATLGARERHGATMRRYHVEHPEAGERQSAELKRHYVEHPERRKKLSASLKEYYRTHSVRPETRRKLSESETRRSAEHPMTDERKAKVSAGLKRYYKEHPEALAAMAERTREYFRNPENRQRASVRQAEYVKDHYDETMINLAKANASSPLANTKIERIVAGILDDLGLSYYQGARLSCLPQPLQKHPFDFVLYEQRLVIECDGIYWHAHPEFFPNAAERPCIAKRVANDKLETPAVRVAGWMMLRFWEHDIKDRPEWVKQVIQETVKLAQARDAIERDAALRNVLARGA